MLNGKRESSHDGDRDTFYLNDALGERLIGEEIDLEIRLRLRFLETIESRFIWALILRENLRRHFFNAGSEDSLQDVDSFKDLAIESLESTESYARTLPVQDIIFPSRQPSVERLQPSIQTVRPHTTRHLHHDPFKQNRKFLYLRDTSNDPPLCYKLVCPDCQRSDFPNTQGLLNHCRLKHKKEHGSHDECIQACAVLAAEEDVVGLEGGCEITGMSLSLRRLFEVAVGSLSGVVQHSEIDGIPVHLPEMSILDAVDAENSTLISQTLGHHKDSPALAPFLGRAPKRRCIHVHETKDEVDVIGGIGLGRIKGVPTLHNEDSLFHKSLGNRLFEGVDISNDDMGEPSTTSDLPTSSIKHTGSRFHFVARVVIADWSRRIPDNDLVPGKKGSDSTHEWKITVSSPSYSLHVSSVLSFMTISCSSHPVPDSLSEPIVVSSPSFSVTGTSSIPFLAKIVLHWVGAQNAPFEADHWVDLDAGKTARHVLGQEQYIDVELDRGTQLLLPQNELGHRMEPSQGIQEQGSSHDVNTPYGLDENSSYRLLNSLLPQFPATAKDIKARASANVPYLLVNNPAQYANLVHGRRKAIEMSRARALLQKYNKSSEAHSSPKPNNLTLVDVYQWLEKGGHFHRPRKTSPHDQHGASSRVTEGVTRCAPGALTQYCPYCGSDSLSRKASVAHHCKMPTSSRKLPIFDVHDLLSLSSASALPVENLKFETALFDHALMSIDPSLIYSIHSILSSLCLSSYHFDRDLEQDDGLHSNLTTLRRRNKLDRTVAALLGLLVNSFIRSLVKGGVRSLQSLKVSTARRLLTPSHIIHGLHSLPDRTMLLAVAHIGVFQDN